MGIKVDPRTGMIVPGTYRPKKPSVSTPKSKPPHIALLSAGQLRELAMEIGTAIASQMKGSTVYQSVPAQSALHQIDESLIDVGLGHQDPLEKGLNSAEMANKTTTRDDLEKAKRSLQALKTGRSTG